MAVRFHAAATPSDVNPGEVYVVDVGGVEIALCNVGGTFYAIKDECTHDGSSFGVGELEGALITCPRHRAVFDVTTGEVLAAPAFADVQTYPVRVRGDVIEVELDL